MARRRQFVTGNPKLNDPLPCARLVLNSGMRPFLHAFHNRSTCFATENPEFRGTPSVELCPSTYLYDASVNSRSTLKPSRMTLCGTTLVVPFPNSNYSTARSVY